LENNEKKKSKKNRLHWLFIGLSVVLIIIALLFHIPARYNPLKIAGDKKLVSTYLTNEVLPALYNGTQLGEPFDLTVTQDGVNDIIARSGWPKDFGRLNISSAMVFFSPGRIELMGTVTLSGVDSAVVVAVSPQIDPQGLLNLKVAKVSVGAVNITPLAGVIVAGIYDKHSESDPDGKNLKAKILASLLRGEPFEPVFKIYDKKVRLTNLSIGQNKLTTRLLPLVPAQAVPQPPLR
jgi:uncharacterized protein YpmS